jgi:uncharacterized protein YdhG (YjbR/CyaY superfamily)
MAKAKNIKEYIQQAPPESQEKLRELYELAKKIVPDATESLKWGMPAFSYKRILFTFAGFKKHLGFYPTPPVVSAFAKELGTYIHSSMTVQFPVDKPLPTTLIKKMITERVDQSKSDDVKWRS